MTESRPVRFVAEWITAQFTNEHGEWEPDRDTYATSSHSTLEAAKAAAVAGSKAANVVEWCAVRELHFRPDLGMPIRSPAAWDEVAVIHGDWEGDWG